MGNFPILSVILFLPLLGAVGAPLLPRAAVWWWALLVAVVDFGFCVWLAVAYNANVPGFQFVEHFPWLSNLGVFYSLGVDGINVYLVGLNALLTIVAVAASWQIAHRETRSREYFVFLMLLSMGIQGVFLATNLFLFYVFWELMLVPAYLLVGTFGGAHRAQAAIKFVLYTAVGSLLMLVAIIAVGAFVSVLRHVPYDLDLTALIRAGVPVSAQSLLFLAFALAFAIKVGLFPFHSWVPDTYSEAPAPVVVLVAGVMSKTGAYGFIRFCVTLFPDAARHFAPLLLGLAVIGILYFALEALIAQDFKLLLAYVSISHTSVIVLAIFALDTQGIDGAVLQMINHGIIIAALFLIAAYIETRTGTRRLADFGGLALRVPWLSTVFLIAALAALGLPGLNSFAGEFLAFLGTFHANAVAGGLATLVVVPAAWYMLRFFQGVSQGPLPPSGPVADTVTALPAPGARSVPALDLHAGELLVLMPLLILIFYLGIVPGVITDRVDPTVRSLPVIRVASPATPGTSSAFLARPASRTITISTRTTRGAAAPGGVRA